MSLRGFRSLLIVGVLCLACTTEFACAESNYKYVGCYKDKSSDKDLKEKEITFSSMRLEDCVSECRKDGWAYAGLQKGDKCFCGPLYNTHGVAGIGACNYTCSDSNECGGALANSVYYTVKTDSATSLQRDEVVHKELTTFENARRMCIQNDGEMATPNNPISINATIQLAVEKGVTGDKIWFGLIRPPTGWYVWTDKDATKLDRDDYENFWYSDEERWQNPCVMLHLPTGKWESTSCHAKYPYVCNQIPPKDGDTEDVPEVIEEEEEEGPSNLALYIVLPLFTLCYGGSCVIYCIGKLYKYCKKKKQKMLLDTEDGFTEFEPETKPKPPPAAAAPAKNPPPPAGRPLKTPVQEFNELPTISSSMKPMYYGAGVPAPITKRGYTPSQSVTSPPDTRPATSQGVMLSMGTTPRSKTPADKLEKRREKLLQNALKEARDRKKDRESKMSNRTDTSSSLDSSTIINENDDGLPIPDKLKRKHKKRESPDSGDSTTDLLAGDDKNDDKAQQQMSIQDIMKVKMLMKDHVSKPRKIIRA